MRAGRTLIVACGALAREILDLKRLNRLDHLDLTCLPAIWHNRPEKIAPAMRGKIRTAKRKGYTQILCGYGDCGTGGALDAVLAEEGVERLEGTHCYAFYAGLAAFEAMHEAEIGTFYLTDYLVRHFERLIITGLGLDRHPELRDAYFGHYTRLMYLAQSPDQALIKRAESAATRLGLRLEVRNAGYGLLPQFLERSAHHGEPRDPLLA